MSKSIISNWLKRNYLWFLGLLGVLMLVFIRTCPVVGYVGLAIMVYVFVKLFMPKTN